MQHLPQNERIGSRCCHALVCQAWCDAAAAARTSFNLVRCSNPHSLTLWLQKYGRLVTAMDLSSAPGLSLSLPCPLLRRLRVREGSLFMAPGSQLAADIMAAKQLSSVRLEQVVFRGDQAQHLASVLAALSNLQVRFGCLAGMVVSAGPLSSSGVVFQQQQPLCQRPCAALSAEQPPEHPPAAAAVCSCRSWRCGSCECQAPSLELLRMGQFHCLLQSTSSCCSSSPAGRPSLAWNWRVQ